MIFYTSTPAGQGLGYCYATNTTAISSTISYHQAAHRVTLIDLHVKVDRMLSLLANSNEQEQNDTMTTQEAADFIGFSKRTFERKVKAGEISPIVKNMKKNRFLKSDIIQLYMACRGHKPPHMP